MSRWSAPRAPGSGPHWSFGPRDVPSKKGPRWSQPRICKGPKFLAYQIFVKVFRGSAVHPEHVSLVRRSHFSRDLVGLRDEEAAAWVRVPQLRRAPAPRGPLQDGGPSPGPRDAPGSCPRHRDVASPRVPKSASGERNVRGGSFATQAAQEDRVNRPRRRQGRTASDGPVTCRCRSASRRRRWSPRTRCRSSSSARRGLRPRIRCRTRRLRWP